MTTFYVGHRPVLKGRDADNSVHYWKNTAGTYSNWELQNSSHVLDGAPDNNLAVGAVRLSAPLFLEYLYAGGHHIAPMVGAGGGERIAGARFRPLEFKGLTVAGVFGTSYGHPDRETSYSQYNNYIYDGLATGEALADPGHALRYDATYGGASKPNVHQGITKAMDDPGQAAVELYGHAKINEWAGVPSTQAL